MEKEKEPKLWVTALKLAVGAIVFIAVVALGLYYTAKYNTYAPVVESPSPDWGITKDSPLRGNR